ncbi:hypothetical protein QYE76_054827 [Lolium multiflorum]|uniref:Uncharacterized protein n=1 Tax=Lolium multiflorum TaxID=4521 RepID=A0AAD8WNC4_LOLMU|nr:hypothetical protein QYE76_054827 [Lolium multiflorum]
MDRERRGKRSFDQFSGEEGRRREQDLRQRLEREQEEQRRQQFQRDNEAHRRREEEGRLRERRGREPRRPHPPPPLAPRGREPGRAAPRPQGSTHGERVVQGRASAEGGAPSSSDVAHIVCYHCGKPGHFQAECKDDPFCVKCNKVGHLSAMCAALSKTSEPFWAGYAADGKGFTCCDVPEEELLPPAPNAAMVILEGGELSAEQLEDELKDLVDEDWDWRGRGLTLPTTKLHIIVTSNAGDPAVVEQLEECWIKLFDVPPPYRHAVRILLDSRELGRPIAVDEASLASPLDPVRVRIGCRAPGLLPPFFILFVNSQGFKVRIVKEGGEGEELSDPLPPPQRKLSDEGDEELEDSEGEGWDGRRGKHKKDSSPAKGKGGSTSVPQRKSVPAYSAQENPGANGPKLPTTAFSQYGSNLTEGGDIFPALAGILQPARVSQEPSGERVSSGGDQLSPSLVSFQESPLVGDASVKSRPSLWKAQQLSEEDRVEAGITTLVTWESDPQAMRSKERRSKANADRPSLALKGVAQHLIFTDGGDSAMAQDGGESRRIEEKELEGELFAEGSVVPELAAPISRAPRSKASPVAAARTSARGASSSATPILEKAIQRAVQKTPAETSLGSDHTPLVFDSGDGIPPKSNRFFFESSWLEMHGFQDNLQAVWLALSNRVGGRDIIDWWSFMSAELRQHLRGWNANKGKENRACKQGLLSQIKSLDDKADAVGIDEEEWALRYHLEDQLLELFRAEEEYWRQRGRVRWVLQGDANTKYFHALANGRRRKCCISSLVSDQGLITDKRLIQQHIYEFYRLLLGSEEARICGLNANAWGAEARVSQEENENLMRTFSEKELEMIVLEMKADTAPGPDGFPVFFFKKFWGLVKLGVLHILNDFILGRIDIARLNFGILSLIPKVPGADKITQFRPIALINVIFKIVSKAFATKLDPIAHRIISPNQTAFIKGRFILDGVLALHEIVHELKVKRQGCLLLKLDFEKAYDRVNWGFLQEVLRAKGFDSGVVHRISQLVMGGQTAISINGEVGPFFRNKRGVRQGDPLSPLLFNFMAEALSKILASAAAAGHIAGVVPHLVPGGITHLQYADDTLILIQDDDTQIANLKFLLVVA